MAARLQAVEIVFEEAIAVLAAGHPAPETLASRIATRSRMAVARLRPASVSSAEAGFALTMNEQVNRLARNLALRLCAARAGRTG